MRFFINRFRAFKFAFSGLFQAFKNEVHLRMHSLISVIVISLGLYYHISKADWFMVLSCITFVICLEIINSALEKLCDRLIPGTDPKIKYVKDVAAGAVLLACIFAVIIGLLVFLPYLNPGK